LDPDFLLLRIHENPWSLTYFRRGKPSLWALWIRNACGIESQRNKVRSLAFTYAPRNNDITDITDVFGPELNLGTEAEYPFGR
jgi:hypothetical protein